MENVVVKIPLSNITILSNFIEFDFGDEDTIIEKEIKCVGVNTTNFINVLFIPESNEFHDVDDFALENIKIEIKSIKRDKIIVNAIAEEGASEKYKFKFIIQWQSN